MWDLGNEDLFLWSIARPTMPAQALAMFRWVRDWIIERGFPLHPLPSFLLTIYSTVYPLLDGNGRFLHFSPFASLVCALMPVS